MPTSELITTREVARLLATTPREVSRIVASGDLTPALTLPYGRRGAFLFDASEVAALAARKGIK